MSAEIAIAGEFGSETSHPIDDAVMGGERCRLDTFYDQVEMVGEGMQRSLVPPAQVMRGRVKHEIRNVGYRGTPDRDGDIDASAGLRALHQITPKPQRIGDVFDNVKRANGVILPGMRSGMLCDRFAPNIGFFGHWGKNRIKPDIGRMRQMTRQPALAAADIKNLISR